MALIKCVECSKQISDIAEICPSCGCDIKLYKEKKQKSYEARRDVEYQERKKKMVECISCKKKFNLYIQDKSKYSTWTDINKRNPNHPHTKRMQQRSQIKNSKISCTNVFLGEYTCIKCNKESVSKEKKVSRKTKSETPSHEIKPLYMYMIHILAWVISLGICYYVFFIME